MTTPNLSKHFWLIDIQCKCGCGQKFFYPQLINLVELVAERLDKTPRLTSVNRCKKHNMTADGSTNSLHLIGAAADIIFLDKQTGQVEKIINLEDELMSLRNDKTIFGGLGIYTKSNFVHLDLGRYRYWRE